MVDLESAKAKLKVLERNTHGGSIRRPGTLGSSSSSAMTSGAVAAAATVPVPKPPRLQAQQQPKDAKASDEGAGYVRYAQQQQPANKQVMQGDFGADDYDDSL